jgi:leader peptidase (prepilin peptidase)/N-methyltransferase
MTPFASLALTAGCWAGLAGIAWGRVRAYGVPLRPNAAAIGASAIMLTGSAAQAFSGTTTAVTAILLACVGVCAVVDLQTGYIFDRVLVAAAVVIGVAAMYAGNVQTAVIGACVGAVLPGLLYALSGGRAIGLGDVKLAALIGWGIGPVPAVHALLAAAVVGGVAAATLLAVRRATCGCAMPFGPFLAFGTACAVWSVR